MITRVPYPNPEYSSEELSILIENSHMIRERLIKLTTRLYMAEQHNSSNKNLHGIQRSINRCTDKLCYYFYEGILPNDSEIIDIYTDNIAQEIATRLKKH